MDATTARQVDELSGTEARRTLAELLELLAASCYHGDPEGLVGDVLTVLRDAGFDLDDPIGDED